MSRLHQVTKGLESMETSGQYPHCASSFLAAAKALSNRFCKAGTRAAKQDDHSSPMTSDVHICPILDFKWLPKWASSKPKVLVIGWMHLQHISSSCTLTGVLADAAAPTDKPLDSTWVAFHVLLAWSKGFSRNEETGQVAICWTSRGSSCRIKSEATFLFLFGHVFIDSFAQQIVSSVNLGHHETAAHKAKEGLYCGTVASISECALYFACASGEIAFPQFGWSAAQSLESDSQIAN